MGESKWLSITQTCQWDTCPTMCLVTLVPSSDWSSNDEDAAGTGWRNRCECQGHSCGTAGPGFRTHYMVMFSGRLGKQKGVMKFVHITCGLNEITLKISGGLQEMG